MSAWRRTRTCAFELTATKVRFGAVPRGLDRPWLFNFATCYAEVNGRVRPETDLRKNEPTN